MPKYTYTDNEQWETGQIINQEKLNNIEEAIERLGDEVLGTGGDGTLNQRINDMVMVQDTQPTSENNEIWIRSTGNGVQVPTYEEFEDLVENTVHLDEQDLTSTQQKQARDNIGAASANDIADLKSALTNITDNSVIKYENKKDTGTAAHFWNTSTGISVTDMTNSYIKVIKAINANATSGYINVSIAYSDGTLSTENYIKDIGVWHKINYNAEKTISNVYIAYIRSNTTVAEAVSSEWEYIILKNKPITERVSDVQSDTDTNTNNIKTLYYKSYLDAEWVTGGWYNGAYYNTVSNRVCTHYKIKMLRDWTVYVADGFRFGIVRFNSDGTYSDSGFVTTPQDLKYGETISLVIARVTEITEVADIYEFLDALTIIPTEGDAGNDYLPAYMVTELNAVRDSLITISKTGNFALCAFDTDQHIMARTKQDRAILGIYGIAYLSKIMPLNNIVLGGDFADYNSTTVDNIILDGYAVQKPIQSARCKVIPMPGNHDANQNNNTVTDYEMFGVNFRNLVSLGQIIYLGDESCNGYYDDASCKIRFIFAQTDIAVGYTYNSQEFITWLGNCLSTLPAGYKAVLFSHHVLTNEYNDTVLHQGRAFQSVINPYASDIICVIAGHSHRDASIVSTSGILYIETTCAWNQKSLYPDGTYYTAEDGTVRTNGTPTETAFDVFAINADTKDVYAVRYGAGSNRTWLIADRIPETSGLTT